MIPPGPTSRIPLPRGRPAAAGSVSLARKAKTSVSPRIGAKNMIPIKIVPNLLQKTYNLQCGHKKTHVVHALILVPGKEPKVNVYSWIRPEASIKEQSILFQDAIPLGVIPNGCADTTVYREFLKSPEGQEKLQHILGNLMPSLSKRAMLLGSTYHVREELVDIQIQIMKLSLEAPNFTCAATYLEPLVEKLFDGIRVVHKEDLKWLAQDVIKKCPEGTLLDEEEVLEALRRWYGVLNDCYIPD